MTRTLSFLALIATIAAPGLLAAALSLASPFGDHMVLQQGMPVPVWGWADAGETVTVEFAGQKKSATADAAGAWRLSLDPLTASVVPREFVVTSTKQGAPTGHYKFADVLVGEVWLCGGQSNMERQLGLRSGQKPIIGWEEAVAAADFPGIRQFYVPQHMAETPRTTTDGAWSVCSPATAADFTAVGFFFARALHQARSGVPVGIIHTSWGGTVAEAWTSQQGLADFPEFAEAMENARRAAVDPEGAQRDYLGAINAWFLAHDPGTKAEWWRPGYDTSAWEETPVPGLWEDHGHAGWDGVAWLHRTFDLPAGWKGRDLTLHLAAVDDVDTTWVNGVEVGTTTFYNTQRTYRVPASALKNSGNEITVRVLDTGGGGGIWDGRLKLGFAPADGSAAQVSLAGRWKLRLALPLADAPRPPQNQIAAGPNVPAVLYNAMLAPLAPYAVRGATFYQGEANASRSVQYRTLLPAMIADWRRTWGQGDFPFLFTQIAPFNGQPPEIREAQLLAWQATKNTAMVVTIDVGDAEDIHPADKAPVGERLALAARAIAYGESLSYSGPIFDSLRIDGTKAIVSFTHVSGGLVAQGGPLYGFAVAGAEGNFVSAQAEIVGSTVVVTAPAVPRPVAVRYGWANFAQGNLCNVAGLPASPFRTDGPKN